MITNLTQKDNRELMQLMADFHLLTGMKICVYDIDGEEVCYYPERLSGFCSKLRTSKKMDNRCAECDKKAVAECRKTGSIKTYVCHAGLTECVMPVIVQGVTMGFVVIGQIRQESSVLSAELKELDKDFELLTVVSEEKLRAAIHILEACTGYEQLKRFVTEANKKIENKIEEFVETHLTDDVSVKRLCSEYYVSRCELYKIIYKAFGCTPAVFVRLRRLRYAKKLLKETKTPVHRIAELCGIGDYNYFSKIFRKEFGITPTDYRKEN